MTLRALYVDFNSYFASVEQQLQPELRGKPIAVLPVMAETTCCIAASYEAKAFGVKTGTKVREARKLCPDIIFIEARPRHYVEYHHKLVEIVESCTHVERTLSIDEMVCYLTGSQQQREHALALASRIKRAITINAGEFIRCSIGIAPNTFLSKLASNMQKPDGCIVIEKHQLPEVLYPLKLTQINGIGRRMESRLNSFKINSVKELCGLTREQLRTAWGSIEGERMHDKLRGFEHSLIKNERGSLGHSHVMPPEMRSKEGTLAVLHRLLQKACARLRSYGLHASMIHLKVKFLNHPSWAIESAISPTDSTLQLTHTLETLWKRYPQNDLIPYATGLTFSGLVEVKDITHSLFGTSDSLSNSKLDGILDKLNMRFGKNTVYFAGAHEAVDRAPMRIAFNHIPNLNTEGDRQS